MIYSLTSNGIPVVQMLFLLCVLLLNSTANLAPVTVCTLDISKAFDRVNNYALLSLLIDIKVPKYFIAIMLKWFQHSTTSVRWGGALSATFDILAGVRQGGLLSPLLFSLYMDVPPPK